MKQCNIDENMMRKLIEELGYKQIGFVEEEMLIASIN